MRGYKLPKDGEFIMRQGWYWPDELCARGHNSPRNKFKHCIQCVRDDRKKNGHYTNTAGAKKWRAENKDRMNELRVAYNKENPEARIVNMCKKVAKDKNLPFNLVKEDIIIPDYCPILGIKLIAGKGKRSGNSPSIDRIIPEKGYTKGNIIIISWRANRIKCDATFIELKLISDFYNNMSKN